MNRAATAALVLVALSAMTACSERIQSADGTAPTSVGSSSSSTGPGSTFVPPSSTVAATTSTTSSTTSTTSTTTTTTTSTTSTTTLPPKPTTTSCEQVVHIGDSTSLSLFEPTGVGGENLTMEQRYRDVGVSTVYPDNDGARAIIEHLDSDPNALEVAQGVRENGYHGCWVLMVGTNDAANIAAGANVNAEERIRRLLDVIGGDPVLWVNAVTQRTEDAYRNASMLAWNDELERVTPDYPNVRLFDWYDIVQPQWFRNDGIHYTVEGGAQRAARTAQALVDNFPAAPPQQ
jgi:hypothetical protein